MGKKEATTAMGSVIIWHKVLFCTGAWCSETLGEALFHLGILCIFRAFSAQMQVLATRSPTSGYFEVDNLFGTFISSPVFTPSRQNIWRNSFQWYKSNR